MKALQRGIYSLAMALICLATPALRAAPAQPLRPALAQFFEQSIRPLLIERCQSCHGAEKHKGGLRLDSPTALLAGGENGVVVVAGHPEQSRLIKAIRYADHDLQMPPKRRLSERQVADLTRWVEMGLPWPDGPAAASAPEPAHKIAAVTDEQKAWWSFQPVANVTPPSVKQHEWVSNGIDAFIAARLEAKGLAPAPQADRRELIRRAYFDLIGLPPTPEEVTRFVADTSDGAFEKVVDELLARPEYGQRWARYWLDLVRYAQTGGYERDGEISFAWRFRDYVIKSLNEDKPYDRFITEQLAGDEIDHVTDDSIIATGFYRLGVVDDEPDDRLQADSDYLDDNIRTISTAFLGLTVGCARCHDHKFDPIPQTDYYQLLACIGNIKPHEPAKFSTDSATYTAIGDPAKIEAEKQAKSAKVAEIRGKMDLALAPGRAKARRTKLERLPAPLQEAFWIAPAQRNAEQKQQAEEAERRSVPTDAEAMQALSAANQEQIANLKQKLATVRDHQTELEWALSVHERGREIPKTNVLIRGNAHSPAAEVRPAFLTALGSQSPALPLKTSNPQSTGLRRALAEWITSPSHPLTARVMVNRIWQYHFGRGIVRTPDDFGKTGIAPTHPELLDWLARRFVDEGWSIKRMHKLMMLSSAYRMSSRATNTEAARLDPDNDLFWRQNMRRLSAEALRDSILAVSGDLNPEAGGRGFFPRLSREAIAAGSRPGLGWEVSPAAQENRRSIYAFLKRSMLPPMLETFDFNNVSMPTGTRPETTVAPQALMLLNDDFMQARASAMAARLAREAGADRPRQIERAFEATLDRKPTEKEWAIAAAYLDRQTAAFAASPPPITFRPEVPSALASSYLNQLKPFDVMSGPRSGWDYGRGKWGGSYEGIVTADPTNTAFALSASAAFSDGVVEARLKLHNGSDLGGLILRGTATGDTHRGYDILFRPRTHELSIERHEGDEALVLATAAVETEAEQWQPVKIKMDGANVRVWIGDSEKPTLEAVDPNPLTQPGSLGVRTWGAAMSIESLKVITGNQTTLLRDADARAPADLALRSFCLMMLNLNEFAYVD